MIDIGKAKSRIGSALNEYGNKVVKNKKYNGNKKRKGGGTPSAVFDYGIGR